MEKLVDRTTATFQSSIVSENDKFLMAFQMRKNKSRRDGIMLPLT